MKLKTLAVAVAVFVGVLSQSAFAAVDPGFGTAMTSIATDVLAYMVAALPLIAGIFGFGIAVKFGLGLIKKVAH
jgi:hypothetical protein